MLTQLFCFFVDGCHKNCDKVFFATGELAPAKSSKKRYRVGVVGYKASYRFSKKLTGKKRQSRALLFNNKKFR